MLPTAGLSCRCLSGDTAKPHPCFYAPDVESLTFAPEKANHNHPAFSGRGTTIGK